MSADYEYGCSCEDMSIEHIEDESFSVEKSVLPTGEILDDGIKLELTKDAIAPEDIFESFEPDDEDLEPTGNEGTTLNRTYHQAALFIWPSKNTIMVTGEIKEPLETLNSKLCESQDSQQLGECEDLAKEIVAAVCKKPDFRPNEEDIITLLSCLKRLKAITLVSVL